MPRNTNNVPKKVAIALFASAYAYFFFVVSVIFREATDYTRRVLALDMDDFSYPKTGAIVPPTFESKDFPCFLEERETKWWKPSKNKEPYSEGFFFLKTHKTGSSTAAGIHLRMARNVAARLTKHKKRTNPMCRVQFDHSTAEKMNYAERSKKNSFLWTIVREPTDRAISQFFHFEVSRKKTEATDESFEQYMLSKKSRTDGFYLRTLSMHQTNPQDGVSQVQAILNDYDFIAVMERMNESVVALQLLLGLTTADILYLNNAKPSGGFDAGGYQGKCTHIQPKNLTSGMIEFLGSGEWSARVKWDRLLWEAANQSLNNTIDSLGRDRFERALYKFNQGQEIAKSQCSEQVIYPCSASRVGKPPLLPTQTDCLWKDSACGTTCLDTVADQLELW